MIDIEHSVIIGKPLEEVWFFVSDPANNPKWQSGVVESKALSSGPIAVGTRVRMVRRFLGRSVETVFDTTEFEPNSMFAFKSVSGPLAVGGSLAVAVAASGTEVTYRARGEAVGVLGLGGAIIGGLVRKQVRNDFRALKKLLESG